MEQESNVMDEITTQMMEYICDNICKHPKEQTEQDALEVICADCKMGQFVCDILNEYNRLNDFDNSQCKKVMEKYAGFVRCNQCEYGSRHCRMIAGLPMELSDSDGCSRGKEKIS